MKTDCRKVEFNEGYPDFSGSPSKKKMLTASFEPPPLLEGKTMEVELVWPYSIPAIAQSSKMEIKNESIDSEIAKFQFANHEGVPLFVNATFQGLLHLEHLTSYLVKKRSDHTVMCKVSGCNMCEFLKAATVFLNGSPGPTDRIIPLSRIRTLIEELSNDEGLPIQNQAAWFTTKMLDYICANTENVSDVFEMQYVDETRCGHCKFEIIARSPASRTLNIEIDSDEINLKQGVEDGTNKCFYCHKQTLSSSTRVFDSTVIPKVLTVFVNYDLIRPQIKLVDINEVLKITTSIGIVEYELKSLIMHPAKPSERYRYFAVCKKKDGKYYKCDYLTVREISINDSPVLHALPHVLFYEQVISKGNEHCPTVQSEVISTTLEYEDIKETSRKELQQPTLDLHRLRKIGFINTGNTCYRNAVVQCLFHLENMKTLLASQVVKVSTTDSPKYFLNQLLQIFNAYYDKNSTSKTLSLDDFGYAIQAISKEFSLDQQEDAEALLLIIIEHLCQELNVDYLFDITYKEQIMCAICGNERIANYPGSKSLIARIPAFDNHPLISSINAEYGEMQCAVCNQEVEHQTVRTFDPSKLPEIFVVSVKYNQETSYPDEIKKYKVDISESVDLHARDEREGATYKLKAVLLHEGDSPKSGHYTAYCKKENGSWYLHNDSEIKVVPTQEVLICQPVTLIYEKTSKNMDRIHLVLVEDNISQNSQNIDDRAASQPSEFQETTTNKPSNLQKTTTNIPLKGCYCKVCNCYCKNSWLLKKHIVSKHASPEEREKAKVHQCSSCPARFLWKSNLNSHVRRVHSGVVPKNIFLCPTCDKSFFQKAKLNDHIIRNHFDAEAKEKAKKHQCTHCTYKCIAKSELQRHMRRIHPIELDLNLPRNFKCYTCKQEFPKKVELRKHILNKHAVRKVSRFTCPTCSAGYATKSGLWKHTKKCPLE